MSAAERWARLAVTVVEATSLPVTVTMNAYPGGVNRYILHRLPSGDIIEIHDRWWRKNADVWIGYEVWISGPDSIVRRSWPIAKKRNEIAAAVCEALTLAAFA